jgi:hypothetical protein
MRKLLRLRWGPGRVGKTRALYLDVIARSEEATLTEISERTGRRRDNVRRSLVMAEARSLVECFEETYRLVPEFAAALDAELEATGIKTSERLDRQRYERERQAYQERIARWRLRQSEVWLAHVQEPDGYIEDLEPLECVEASPEPENPGLTPDPVPESQPGPGREIVQSIGKFASDALITDASDPDRFRELAYVLRTGQTRLEAHQARRSARRQARRLDREGRGYERRKDGARVSPAAFLCSELRGVSGMGYLEMLRRWEALGGKAETLEGAITAGPYQLKRKPMDFNRPYVYPAVQQAASRSEQGAV